VLDTHYAEHFHRDAIVDRSIIVYDLAESTVTPLMERIEREFAGIKVYSLPSVGEGGVRRHIELGIKGARQDEAGLAAAFAQLEQGVAALGGRYEPKA
jgi:molybdopterin-biosynthesis enzyme MoeA-like protein